MKKKTKRLSSLSRETFVGLRRRKPKGPWAD